MKREEAIKELRSFIGQLTEGCREAIKVLIPELKESEDERIRDGLIQHLKELRDWKVDTMCPIKVSSHYDAWIAWLEKQKENIEKEYVFRPLAGTDIITAANQAVRRANKGAHLVLAFNGAYIPVRKGCNVKELVDEYDAYLEKQKEQKPSKKWSEDDKFKLEDAITGIDVGIGFYEREGKHPNLLKAIIEAKEWLKSLRPSWKPSEEQILALRTAVIDCPDDKELLSLYEDLKKL